ncbi:putative fucosyltransferase-like protein, partial [Apostichopus japonicus]
SPSKRSNMGFSSLERVLFIVNTACYRGLTAVFNITLTYLSDSDIVVPYGVFTPFKSTTKKKKKKQLKDSPSLINWAAKQNQECLMGCVELYHVFVDRLGFVKHLSTYLPVDMFGKCGNLSCRKEKKDHCEKVFSQYKFYLALENTPCREYITEKVWHNSFERGLIPVVFGADKSDYVKILPENSFIFAEDFNSTQQLARFFGKSRSQ